MDTALVEQEAAQRISDTVTALLEEQPFFATLALRMRLEADPHRVTIAGNGQWLRYNPHWVHAMTTDTVMCAVARVVFACALKHHTRRGDRIPALYQRASQLVTHAFMKDSGLTLPEGARAWPDMSVEEAYDRLLDEAQGASAPPTPPPPKPQPAPDRQPPQPGMPPPDAKAPAPQPHDTATQVPAPPDTKADDSPPQAQPPSPGDGTPSQSPGTDSDPSTGNGANGAQSPQSSDPYGTGEVADFEPQHPDPAHHPGEIQAEEQAWDEGMHQAVNIAEAAGRCSASIREKIRGAHTAPYAWARVLARELTDRTLRDYTWSIPNMRFIDAGLYLPSLDGRGSTCAAVLLDVSSSMPSRQFPAIWSQVRHLMQQIDIDTLIVIQVDTKVKRTDVYRTGHVPRTLDIVGRGGTNFIPGFRWLRQHRWEPRFALYFTDMQCRRYPKRRPTYPVVWLNWGDPKRRGYPRAPFGRQINIPKPRYAPHRT